MSDKIKKLLIAITAVMIVVAIVAIAVINHKNSTPGKGTNTGEESHTSVSPTPVPDWETSATPETEEVEETEERVVSFIDDRVHTTFTEKDYLSSTDPYADLDIEQEIYSEKVTNSGYSKGYLLVPTDYLMWPTGGTDGEGSIFSSNYGIVVHVQEYNASEYTTAMLRKQYIETNLYMPDYLKYTRENIMRTTEVVLGQGLKYWKDYFVADTPEDYSITGGTQIFADCTEKTAYGSTKYFCWYTDVTGKYTAYAWISCDGGRILEVSTSADSAEDCWSYIVEATNNAIKLLS